MVEEPNDEDDAWLALGLRLRLLTTAEGGRRKPLGLPDAQYERYQYRPNWGLPGMEGTDQLGGFVLTVSPFPVDLGETVRAVIVPLYPASMPLWRNLGVGDRLNMFEGPRVCGEATVEVVWETQRPLPDADADQFEDWAGGQHDAG